MIILAKACNDVDKDFSPGRPKYQALHFNVSDAGETDSRLEIAIILMLCAASYFSQAEKAEKYSAEYYRLKDIGLGLLGTLLHPLQDFYAHTKDVG
ncbi:MAG: hypothetical protein RR552_03940, partial [Oscillospiraceae bacterium]